MEIINSEYIGSFPNETLCPKDRRPEYAFIGRSNVGKSSLINMLCDRKNLARTSKQPGKTQYLNYYSIDKVWHLVDLPGYGYAKISKKKRAEWKEMIYTYFEKREQLNCAMVLVDANIPPQKIDIEFMGVLAERGVPFVIVYTKTDRMTPNQKESNIAKIRKELLNHWTELPQEFITSSNSGEGKEEILEFIDTVNQRVLSGK
ncbi:MAG: GTP-binding protein [Paraglaciecola sp.]